MATTTASWGQTRQKARELENQTASEFNTLSQYASSSELALKPTEGEIGVKERIDKLLEGRTECLQQLQNNLNTSGTNNSSALREGHFNSHSKRLTEDQQELERLNAKIESQRRATAHLTTVHSTLGGIDETTRRLLDERSAIERSTSMIDNMLTQAYDTRDNFLRQNEMMANINRRIAHASGHIPGMTTLMSSISSRKRRDGVLLGSFMAFCFLLFFYIT